MVGLSEGWIARWLDCGLLGAMVGGVWRMDCGIVGLSIDRVIRWLGFPMVELGFPMVGFSEGRIVQWLGGMPNR